MNVETMTSMNLPVSEADRLAVASRLHLEGRQAEAMTLYRDVLATAPDHPRALVLLATLLVDTGAVDEAEGMLRRRLGLTDGDSIVPETLAPALAAVAAPEPDIAASRLELAMVLFELGNLRQRKRDDRASILLFETATGLKPDYSVAFNNMALSLHRLGRRDLALDVVQHALAIDPAFTVALRNLGQMLLEARQPEAACAAFEHWTAIEPGSVEAKTKLGIAALAIPDAARAEAALRRALALDPNHVEAYVQLANVLDHDHRHGEALGYRREAARRHGVVSQASFSGRTEARVLVVGGAGLCNLNLQCLLDRNRFDATIAYLQPEGEEDAVFARPSSAFPPFDIVINSIADVDNGGEFLEKARAFCARFGRPVINAPDHRIARTTRNGVAGLLEGIGGLTVPSTRRLSRIEVAAMAERPLTDSALLRPVGAHGGDDLERIDKANQIDSFLARVPSESFYLTAFHDYRSADGYWRKYRLVFVDRAIFPYHLTIGHDWKLHYYRVDMTEQAWMKPEEEAFLADWRSVFDGPRGEAITEVARRLDLDFAGIDCAIGADGNVVLFEANPTMLVHLSELPVDYPHKHRYVPRIFDAFGTMLVRRAAENCDRAA